MHDILKKTLDKKYLLFILILYTVLSGLLLNADLPIIDEGPCYFLLSKSILSGEGYNNMFYPNNPSNIEYPPFYPLFLVIISMVFPKTIVGLKMLSILFGIGSLIIIYSLFCADCQRALNDKYHKLPCNYCWGLLLIICTSPLFIAYSVRVVAEMSYLFLSLTTIFLLEKYTRQDNSNKLYFWGGTITLIFALYTKTLGLSLATAVFVYFFIKKKYKDLVIISGLSGFCFLPWIIRNILVSGVPTQYLDAIVSGYKVSSLSLPKLIFWNGVHYGQAVRYILLPGCFLSKLSWYLPSLFSLVNERMYFKFVFIRSFSMFLVGGAAFGFYFKARKKISLVEIYILCYFLMLLLCPYDFFINDGNKYLYQVMPFLVYYFISGLFGFSQKITFLHFHVKKTIGCFLILIMTIPNLICDFYLIKGNMNYLINCKNFPREERIDYYAPWFNIYFMAAFWVKEKLPPDACIMHSFPYTFYLYSRHKTISLYLDKNAVKNNLQDIREGNAGYIAVGTQREEKMVQELNRVSKNYIFMPLISFIRVVGKNKLSGFSKIYKIISVKPRMKLLYQEGSYFYNNKNYKQATLKFKEALQISPDLAGYYNLGIIYEKRGMVREAIRMYESALKNEPNFQVVENRLNILYQREVLKQNTHDLAEYKKLGDYYLENHDYSKAISTYTKCLQMSREQASMDKDKREPDISLIYYNLGKAYFSWGNYEQAKQKFKKSLKINPDFEYNVKHYVKLIDRLKK